MSKKDPRREAFFPKIEARTGQPMSHWFAVMESLAGHKYDEQMAVLQNEHGFARTHANALIMFMKGSTSSRRVETADDYFAALPEPQATTARRIVAVIGDAFPELEQVIAWNQPMFRMGTRYLFGVMAASKHLLIAPFDPSVLDGLSDRLDGLHRNKKTVRVPNDWQVDEGLLIEMVGRQLP